MSSGNNIMGKPELRKQKTYLIELIRFLGEYPRRSQYDYRKSKILLGDEYCKFNSSRIPKSNMVKLITDYYLGKKYNSDLIDEYLKPFGVYLDKRDDIRCIFPELKTLEICGKCGEGDIQLVFPSKTKIKKTGEVTFAKRCLECGHIDTTIGICRCDMCEGKENGKVNEIKVKALITSNEQIVFNTKKHILISSDRYTWAADRIPASVMSLMVTGYYFSEMTVGELIERYLTPYDYLPSSPSTMWWFLPTLKSTETCESCGSLWTYSFPSKSHLIYNDGHLDGACVQCGYTEPYWVKCNCESCNTRQKKEAEFQREAVRLQEEWAARKKKALTFDPPLVRSYDLSFQAKVSLGALIYGYYSSMEEKIILDERVKPLSPRVTYSTVIIGSLSNSRIIVPGIDNQTDLSPLGMRYSINLEFINKHEEMNYFRDPNYDIGLNHNKIAEIWRAMAQEEVYSYYEWTIGNIIDGSGHYQIGVKGECVLSEMIDHFSISECWSIIFDVGEEVFLNQLEKEYSSNELVRLFLRELDHYVTRHSVNKRKIIPRIRDSSHQGSSILANYFDEKILKNRNSYLGDCWNAG
jgi:hypothetical protein